MAWRWSLPFRQRPHLGHRTHSQEFQRSTESSSELRSRPLRGRPVTGCSQAHRPQPGRTASGQRPAPNLTCGEPQGEPAIMQCIWNPEAFDDAIAGFERHSRRPVLSAVGGALRSTLAGAPSRNEAAACCSCCCYGSSRCSGGDRVISVWAAFSGAIDRHCAYRTAAPVRFGPGHTGRREAGKRIGRQDEPQVVFVLWPWCVFPCGPRRESASARAARPRLRCRSARPRGSSASRPRL